MAIPTKWYTELKKLLLFAILILTSCASNEEENCNCKELIYEREYFDSSSWINRYQNQRTVSGCYTEEEARREFWITSDRFSIIQCDEYLD